MSIRFDGTGTKYVKWTAPAGVVGLTSKSISLWFYYSTSNDGWALFRINDGTGTDADEKNSLYSPSPLTLKLRWDAHFSTTDGAWITTNNVLTVGEWHHIVLTYDGSATANNALIYVNGASVAVTRGTAPVGTYRSGTSTDLYIGDNLFSGFLADGDVLDLRVYTGILTASQVSALYAAGANTPNFDTGLVFNAPLTTATALSGASFDGYTLTSSQLLIDRIGCAQGTPSGSPLGSATEPS